MASRVLEATRGSRTEIIYNLNSVRHTKKQPLPHPGVRIVQQVIDSGHESIYATATGNTWDFVKEF